MCPFVFEFVDQTMPLLDHICPSLLCLMLFLTRSHRARPIRVRDSFSSLLLVLSIYHCLLFNCTHLVGCDVG